jgi:hypothetical protein
MKNHAALKGLEKIYALYDQFFCAMRTACGKGCATCCTANVTMTTLEGLFMLDHWQAQGRKPPVELLRKSAQNPGFQPTLTINQLAALCLEDKQIPDESADPGAGPCPLLRNDHCTLYAARPFGCRAMVSLTDCAHSGEADMPDFVLAANNLISQFIEALDHAGRFGNLADILLLLSAPATVPPTRASAARNSGGQSPHPRAHDSARAPPTHATAAARPATDPAGGFPGTGYGLKILMVGNAHPENHRRVGTAHQMENTPS